MYLFIDQIFIGSFFHSKKKKTIYYYLFIIHLKGKLTSSCYNINQTLKL